MIHKTESILREIHAVEAALSAHAQQQKKESTSPQTHQPSSLQSRISVEQEIARMREIRQRSYSELIAQKIIHPDMIDKRVYNSFRHLRTTLFQKAGMHNFILMVSAVSSNGGASFVARNLAVAIAFDRAKTALLVDCNLTRRTVDNLICTDGDLVGLTDYLCGIEPKIEEIIYPTGIPRLRAVPSGSKQKSVTEYFTSSKLRILLQDIRQRYPERCIVLDAPPMDEPDARILSDLCDHVLLVVPYGRATKMQLMSAISHIEPEKLIGTVINNVPVVRTKVDPNVANFAHHAEKQN